MIFINQLNQGIRNTDAIIKQRERRRFTVHSSKSKIPPQQKGKFVFEPPKAIQSQIDSFFQMCKRNLWDRKLAFKGYKGTFKVEHFIMVETQLRILWPLRELYFVDTQMDKEHLIILRQWLSWLQPEKLTLEFQQNEIDDQDFEEFIYFIFDRDIDLKRLYIISNPGIYKGQLLKQLENYLQIKYQNNENYEYRLIKNKDSKSAAIIKILKDWTQKDIDIQIQIAKEKIDQTCFYSFQLANCFTEKNYKGFEHLIQLTYDLDNLEQISGLDISDNYLGTLNSFATTCQHMSTAKGLLELRIRKQSLLEYSTVVSPLMGDRYDKLRVNIFDITGNSSILEKTFKIFSDEIFLYCKEIVLNNVLTQQLSTLYKLSVMTGAFQERTEYLKEQTKKNGKIIQHNYNKFDLSTVENYNRHDLVEKFLNNVIFSEYSKLKKLILQNMDIGRMEAYTKSLQKFREYLSLAQQTNPLLKSFKLPLKEITMPNQTYRMEIPTIKIFFLNYFFTKKGDILEIETFNMVRCFRQSNREEGIKETCKEIYAKIQEGDQSLKDVQYTMKNIKMEDTTCNLDLDIYKCLLLTDKFQLESLQLIKDGWDGEFNTYHQETLNYLSKQPSDFIHSLKNLVLNDVESMDIELNQFLMLFVYNPQMRLTKIELQNITVRYSDTEKEKFKEFKQQIKPDFESSLQELIIGQFSDSGSRAQVELCFFDEVIITKYSRLKKLSINKFESLDLNCVDINAKLQQLQSEGNIPFKNLTFLSISDSKIENQQSWIFIMEYILFHDQSQLIELLFQKQPIDSLFSKALEKATAERVKYLTSLLSTDFSNGQTDHKAYIPLKKMEFIECTFQVEFLSYFLPQCELAQFEIIKCKDVEQSLKQTMELYEKQEVISLFNIVTLETFTLEECKIEDYKVFEWFINEIIFNIDRQKIKHLSIIKCSLTDEHINLFGKRIDKIKKESLDKRRYYNLRSINLSGNSSISEDSWMMFFDKLMEQKRNKNEDQQQQEKQNRKLEDINKEILEENDAINESNINMLAKETSEFIASSELNVKDKMITNFQLFRPNFPKTLLNLSLQLEFPNMSSVEKDIIYYRIIAGFIINPESQLNQLKLTNVDLGLFMKNVQKAQSLVSILVSNCYQQDIKEFKSKLNILDFQVKQQLAEEVQIFVQTFICSNHVDLKQLTLSGFDNSGIVSQILEQIPKKSQYQLEELQFNEIKEQLTESETFSFVNNIVMGKAFPLKILSICSDIKFSEVKLSELLFDQHPIKMEKIVAKITDEPNQEEIYRNILELLLSSTCRLKSLDLSLSVTKDKDGKANQPKTFNDVFESILDRLTLKELFLEEIILSIGILNINEKWLSFIIKSINTLKLLSIKQININDDDVITSFVESKGQNFKFRKDSQIDIKVMKGAGTSKWFEQFIFNHNFGFERVILRDPENFSNIKQLINYQNFKSLKIDMALLYNSSTQLSESALTLIAEKFIYNEESLCEEIFLNQLHLKPPGVKALVKPAEQFRQNAINSGRQGVIKLNLKSINIYYSLYLGIDGTATLMKDLFFFEYISAEQLAILVTNFNSENCISMVDAANNWITFQKQQKREFQNNFPLKYLDIGRNEFVQDPNVWHEYLSTLVFSDLVPLLETCNLHFMAINDQITEWIVKECRDYLDHKPKSFKMPLKKINFSQNNSLTKIGWKNIFTNFFLHPKIDLIELNMISTMLDSQEKLNAIYDCFKERIKLHPNGKIPMQAFLCYNVTLKDMINPFITPMPKDYQIPKDLPVSIDYTSWKFGHHDGIPEEFGAKVLTYNRILSRYEEFIDTSKWKQYEDIKFATYQLNFASHYLKILNDYYRSLNERQIQIYLNLTTLNVLSTIFKYCTERPGEPYPYKLVLQNDTYQFLKTRQSSIYKLNFIQIDFPNLEIIKQQDILAIWKQVKSWRSSIDQIQIEYTLTDDLCEEMFEQGYTERDILSLIRIIPPKVIRLQGGLSLPAIKGLYSVLYDIHYFSYSTINYGFDTFLNTGIGYALRESAYNYKEHNQLTFILKKAFYRMYNFFVSKTEKYTFDDEIIQLNNFLSSKKKYFFLIAFNNILFWLVTIISPYFFTHYYNGDSTKAEQAVYCNSGTSKQANWIYYGFAALSFLIEVYLFYWFQKQIPSHVEKIEIKVEEDHAEQQEEDDLEDEKIDKAFGVGLKNKVAPLPFIEPEANFQQQLGEGKDVVIVDKDTDSKDVKKNDEQMQQTEIITKKSMKTIRTIRKQKEEEHFTEKMSKKFRQTYKYFQLKSKKIAESKYIEILNHIIGLVLSQLYKFDLYNDVVFILTCLYCEERILFTLTLIITSVTQGIYFLQFLYLLYIRITQTETTAKILSTKFINDIYAIAFLGRNQAITNQLDRVSPYNVSIIPNNWLTRRLLPNQAGRSMSNPVKAYFMQFMLEDLPQTFLQAYFVVKRAMLTGSLSAQVYLIIVTSIYNFFSSFYLFMSIRPSTLSQDEFDLLSNRKKKEYHAVKMKQLEQEKRQLKIYQDLYSTSKMASPLNPQVAEEQEALL